MEKELRRQRRENTRPHKRAKPVFVLVAQGAAPPRRRWQLSVAGPAESADARGQGIMEATLASLEGEDQLAHVEASGAGDGWARAAGGWWIGIAGGG